MVTDMKLEGAHVRALRERRAWSQEHLAAVSGLSARTVQRIEAGGAASYETFRALAAALELTPEEFARAGAASEPAMPGAAARSSTPALAAWGNGAGFCFGLIVSTWAALGPFLVMPMFRDNLSSFLGDDMPWLTRWALQGHAALLILPVAVLLAWFGRRGKPYRGLVCLAIGAGGALLGTLLLVFALQLPLWRI